MLDYDRPKRPINPAMVREGRKIVLTVAAVHIASSIVGFFSHLYTFYFFFVAFSIFIFHVMVTVALVRGWNMARYMFAINTMFWAYNAVANILFTGVLSGNFTWVSVFSGVTFLYAICAGTLLFTSKDVEEYMYDKNEGW